MLKHLLFVATSVVGSCLLLLFLMVSLNAWACISGSFYYEIPESVTALISMVFGLSCTILGVSGVILARAEVEYQGTKTLGQTQVVTALEAEKIAEIIEIEAEPLSSLINTMPPSSMTNTIPSDEGFQIREDASDNS